MSWPTAAALFAALTLVVHAAPASANADATFFEIDAPDDFPVAESLAGSIASDVERTPYFGERPADSGAAAYAAQGEGAFYVWWAAGAPTDDPAAAIRAALDHVQRAPAEASPQAGSVSIDGWDEIVEDDIATADFAWRHLSNETLTLVRAKALASSDGAPRIVAARCVMHIDREDEVRPTCESALASLAITAPEDRRMALDGLPAGEPVKVATSVPELETGIGGDGEDAAETGGGGGGPQIGAPQEGVLYEERERPERGDGGLNWLLILGAVFVAVAVYVTMRSRRSESDASSEQPADHDTDQDGDDRDD